MERQEGVHVQTMRPDAKEAPCNFKKAYLRKELLKADQRNVWDAVFDISSVRGDSFRMPFNEH